MIFHGSSKLQTLMIFPSIFKGEHIKHEKFVTVHTGHDISVKFDRPTALQIDGETILGVTEYKATAKVPAVIA
jgi:diacylglycerol kinase family enzyme